MNPFMRICYFICPRFCHCNNNVHYSSNMMRSPTYQKNCKNNPYKDKQKKKRNESSITGAVVII